MTDHLKFCNVCVNKKWELKTGIYCGLTDKRPDFINECQKFSYSHENYLKLISDKQSFYERILTRKPSGAESKTIVEVTRKVDDHRITNYQQLDNKIEYFLPVPLKWIFRKPVFTITDKGILFNEKVVKWNEIIYTSFHTEWENINNRESKNQYLVIDAISPELTIKIPITLGMKKKEIGHIIELFKEKNNVG